MKIAYVEWVDSASFAHWTHDHEDASPAYCKSIGFVVHEDKGVLKLALNRSESGGMADIICIPKACITSRTLVVTHNKKAKRKAKGGKRV